jgi:hypothetical protein
VKQEGPHDQTGREEENNDEINPRSLTQRKNKLKMNRNSGMMT